MAIIACPECGGSVSDRAASCPHCGYLIRAVAQFATGPRSTVTTQRTAKSLKAQRALAGLVVVCGIGLAVAGYVNTVHYESGEPRFNLTPLGNILLVAGGCVFVVGLFWYIAARVAAWWHHD